MLYPQQNNCRSLQDLSGFWELRADPDHAGFEKGWNAGFEDGVPVGVPGSLNEQLAELGLMNYVGPVWYQFRFSAFPNSDGLLQRLWFGSADHQATVWVNGVEVGEHLGGYIPFELEVTQALNLEGDNLLVVRVDNTLDHDTIPQGATAEDFHAFNLPRVESFPPTVPDFFIYGGLPRPVRLVGMNKHHIESLRIVTGLKDSTGTVEVTATLAGEIPTGAKLRAKLLAGGEAVASNETDAQGNSCSFTQTVTKVRPWCPEDPFLYTLQLELFVEGELVDSYRQPVGIREIKLEKGKLLLNGKPLFLTGFGKHEDFAILGKGLSYPVIAKDFHLMKWIGANSFRTSHYPYADEIMQLADRMGFLVVDEVPAVSLNMRHVTPATLENHKRALTELIERDRNHACVIAWSVANEAGIWGEPEAKSEEAKAYWREVVEHTRSLDTTRPLTIVTCPKVGREDPAYEFSDFISVNRYWGWYEFPGDLVRAKKVFAEEMAELHRLYGKPILVTEFGVDTIEGLHSTTPQFFTEEFQVDFIETYFDVIENDEMFIGEHIWNFADFRTAQHHRRVVHNRKGVFNRQREPKLAAFRVRDRWTSLKK